MRKGIDISKWNKEIDYTKLKEQGIEFAIIRCGFRGHGTGSLNVDARFYDNMKGAIANDIQVGVYFFTAAINEAEAQEEAHFVLNWYIAGNKTEIAKYSKPKWTSLFINIHFLKYV